MKRIELEDELAPFMGDVCEVRTERFSRPLYGRMISIGPLFVTFERHDGRQIAIRKRDILQIQPAKRGGDDVN
jgi:hypothetical protein